LPLSCLLYYLLYPVIESIALSILKVKQFQCEFWGNFGQSPA
jgi:hypothetical protein